MYVWACMKMRTSNSVFVFEKQNAPLQEKAKISILLGIFQKRSHLYERTANAHDVHWIGKTNPRLARGWEWLLFNSLC